MDCDISIARDFSMKCEKYNENSFISQWNILEKRDKPSIGTLLYFLQESVPEDCYKELIKNLRKFKNKKIEKGNYLILMLVIYLKKDTDI